MPAISMVELTGGAFQDAEGNLLSGGYLTFVLNQDGNVNDSQICAGIKITVNLDGYGSVIGGQFLWGNDQLSPVNSYYKVTGFKANGELAFGPNNQQVLGNGGTFDVGTWIPNQVFSWVPPLQPLGVEVNGVLNTSQLSLNFVNTPTVVFSNPSTGVVTATAIIPPSAPPALPQPQVARYALWQPPVVIPSTTNPPSVSPGPTNCFVISGDSLAYTTPTLSGSTNSLSQFLNPPTSTTGASVTCTPTGIVDPIWMLGQSFIFPARSTIFRGVITYTTVTGNAGNQFFGLSSLGQNVNGYSMNHGIDPLQLGGSFDGDTPSPILPDAIGLSWKYSGTGPFGDWSLGTSKAGLTTLTSTGVPVVSGQRLVVEITLISGVATLYLNGIIVATTSTNVPIAPLGITWSSFSNTFGGDGDPITVEYMYAENASV